MHVAQGQYWGTLGHHEVSESPALSPVHWYQSQILSLWEELGIRVHLLFFVSHHLPGSTLRCYAPNTLPLNCSQLLRSLPPNSQLVFE